MPRLWFVAFATRATHEIITVLWGVASVSIVKRRGFKQFMAEEYLFSEIHAGFHTWSSMKYSLNWRPGELQHFIAVMCGQANLTCHVECLTSACCVCETYPSGKSTGSNRHVQYEHCSHSEPERKPVLFVSLFLGHFIGQNVQLLQLMCAVIILFLCRKLDNVKIKTQDCRAWITSEMYRYLQTTN